MRQWDYNIQMAMIRTLRELDTEGEHEATCDREELDLRRRFIDEPMITRGGISWRATSFVAVELLRLHPQVYCDLTRAYRPRGFRDYSSPAVRKRIWAESAEQAKKDLPVLKKRWARAEEPSTKKPWWRRSKP